MCSKKSREILIWTPNDIHCNNVFDILIVHLIYHGKKIASYYAVL